MNKLAQELNTVLETSVVGRLLSQLGKRMYFPKGIIAQSAEAKKLGKKANGTIGMAVKNGKPIMLSAIKQELPHLNESESVGYAPTGGFPELQEYWKKEIIKKNPLLAKKNFSLPVVVPGLTAGLSYIFDLFLDEGQTLLTANPAWDNYILIADARRNAHFAQFELFKNGGFNVQAFKQAVETQAKKGAVRVLLNFPQNPSGYTPTKSEAQTICAILIDTAKKGCDVLVLCDDAYFGLFYEEETEKQSLFAYLADECENLLAVKIDGPTKEDYVWGFRSGFLTFNVKGLSAEQYEALNKKVTGTIRSSVSCTASPTQAILLKAVSNSTSELEKNDFKKMLEKRYNMVKKVLESKKTNPVLTPLPFNSGYFMSMRCNGFAAEDLRKNLLNEHGIGVIAIDESHIRVAFSSIDDALIPEVYETIFSAAEKLAK